MYIVNSSGPKMEHCGTPRFTNKGVDWCRLTNACDLISIG
jgi:hypothetical protein